MTFIAYTDRNFRKGQLEMIGFANQIISSYSMPITVRQLYYQFVAKDAIPNTPKSYASLQSLISEGRMAGLISWDAIEDRGRSLMGHKTYDNPSEALKDCRRTYKIEMWENQPIRPEVWVEKQALEGVVGQICDELRVDFFATRGYNSQSEQWRAGRRFASRYQRGQRPVVLHLGDHDPSGIDMTRDNRERLELFTGFPVIVKRIALNMDQIEEFDPPPNPAKITDSRAEDYIAKFGESSWELDALSPETLQDLIEREVLEFRDPALWDEALKREASDKNDLDAIIEEVK